MSLSIEDIKSMVDRVGVGKPRPNAENMRGALARRRAAAKDTDRDKKLSKMDFKRAMRGSKMRDVLKPKGPDYKTAPRVSSRLPSPETPPPSED